ncbi:MULTISPECIES: hypothetical protein [Streptomyces]|uniref:Uncharacterized protein n=1 Tax=Streptomyces mordarskii TaxID=1226758 RepID=A0ABN1DWY5_9ACTN
MLMQLVICAVLFLAGISVSLWAIFAPIDRKEVQRMGRRDSHTP